MTIIRGLLFALGRPTAARRALSISLAQQRPLAWAALTTGLVTAVLLSRVSHAAVDEAGQGVYQLEPLKSFGDPSASGGHPNGLIQARDGALYGTTSHGGSNDGGTVFKINRDGTDYRTLHVFGRTGEDGSNPTAPLIEGRDGLFYGTTAQGGFGNGGIVFRLNNNGGEYKVLHSFGGVAGNEWSEWNPNSALLEGSDGVLYGTTTFGFVFRISRTGETYAILGKVGSFPSALIEGRDGFLYGRSYHGGVKEVGMIFRIGKDGKGLEILHSFTGGKDDGQYGSGELLEASDGLLYGTTYWGGADGAGIVFRLNTQGGDYKLLRNFSRSGGDAGFPQSTRLSEGRDGTLFGVSLFGGNRGQGALFKLAKDGSGYSVPISFKTDGVDLAPAGSLVVDHAGMLLGTTGFDGAHHAGTVFQVDAQGSGFAILFDFEGGRADQGHGPTAELLLSRDGRLYGTTSRSDGTSSGTVFRLNRDGSGFGVLHTFAGRYVARGGGHQQHGLIEGRDDALYGTTQLGGGAGHGSVFKLNKDGTGFRVLHDFTSDDQDEQYPKAGLLQGTDGALYGTTSAGGNEAYAGAVFKLGPDGNGYAVLHRFALSSGEGSSPRGRLLEGSDGALYGTTAAGGAFDFGTIFSLDRDGDHATRVVYSFTNDRAQPSQGVLLEGSDHALYGLNRTGVFKVNKDGSEFKLVRSLGQDDGSPGMVLTKGFGRTLYGVAADGGRSRMGTVFRLSEDGTGFTVLHAFAGPEGAAPVGALVLSSDGVLYGTTVSGGGMSFGTVFALHPRPVLLP